LLAVGIHAIRKSNKSLESVRIEVLLPAHGPHYEGKRHEVMSLDRSG
jgi:hypothetical protein